MHVMELIRYEVNFTNKKFTLRSGLEPGTFVGKNAPTN